MEIAVAQINLHIGHFESNTQKIIQYIELAREKGAELVIFPELAICGYPPGDFLENENFIRRCELAVEEIAAHCIGISAIVGTPYRNPKSKGKKLFNAALLLTDGKVADAVYKSLLPNYDIFDEYRYFEPNRELHVVQFKDKKLAITICEDIWNIYTPFYTLTPMDELAKSHPDMIINISASPFSSSQHDSRMKVLVENAKKYKLPVIYVNHVGGQTDLIFDGGSTVVSANGNVFDQLDFFQEEFRFYQTDDFYNDQTNSYPPAKYSKIE